MMVDVLVEEESAKIVLEQILPAVIPGVDHRVIAFRGRPDLLKKAPGRLQGYASLRKGFDQRVAVLVGRDRDDCRELKVRLEKMAIDAGLATLARPAIDGGAAVVTRIAIEELEAWFFGDVPALSAAFPGVPASLGSKAAFRNPDAINGGTAERLVRELNRAGHFADPAAKIAIARHIAPCLDVESTTSPSFIAFRDGLRRLVSRKAS